MAKKALKEVTKDLLSKSVRAGEPALSVQERGGAGEAPGVSPFAARMLEEISGKPGSPDSQLSALVESVAAHLGDKEMEKAQLNDFLTLLLDTDPTLKEEILSGLADLK